MTWQPRVQFGGFFFTYYPDGFSASAYYGFLAIATDKKNWNAAANSWEWPLPIKPLWLQNQDYRDRYEQLTGVSLRLCPVCRQGRMIRIELPTCFAHPSP